MQTAPDRALSLASQLPPRSLQPLGAGMPAQVPCQLPPRSLQAVGAGMPEQVPCGTGPHCWQVSSFPDSAGVGGGMPAQATCGSGLARDSVRSVTACIAGKPFAKQVGGGQNSHTVQLMGALNSRLMHQTNNSRLELALFFSYSRTCPVLDSQANHSVKLTTIVGNDRQPPRAGVPSDHVIVGPYRPPGLCQLSADLPAVSSRHLIVVEYVQARGKPFYIRQISFRVRRLFCPIDQFH